MLFIIIDDNSEFWWKLIMHETLCYMFNYVIAHYTSATNETWHLYETSCNLRYYSMSYGNHSLCKKLEKC